MELLFIGGLIAFTVFASVVGFIFRMVAMYKGAQQIGRFVQEIQRYAILSQNQQLEDMYRQIAYFANMQQPTQARVVQRQAEAQIQALPPRQRKAERGNLGAVVERRKVLNPRSGEWEDAA